MSTVTPLKAIRAKCLDCCCGQGREVRACPASTCALWPYRQGARPRAITPEPSVSGTLLVR
ncbi:MAG TPA: hypothetical protein VGM23_03850 [Armatimonadota bacterium]|jgi:hypothetical protein